LYCQKTIGELREALANCGGCAETDAVCSLRKVVAEHAEVGDMFPLTVCESVAALCDAGEPETEKDTKTEGGDV
jgi:hypothetical protein